ELGFEVLKTVKRRLDEHHRDAILWMKVSEITDYWCAKELAQVAIQPEGRSVTVRNAFAVPKCTLRLPGVNALDVQIDGRPLAAARRENLKAGTWCRDGGDTVAAWDLPAGGSTVTWRSA